MKDFAEDSYVGLTEFRNLFRLPKLEELPNYNIWKHNVSLKTLTNVSGNKFLNLLLNGGLPSVHGDPDFVGFIFF